MSGKEKSVEDKETYVDTQYSLCEKQIDDFLDISALKINVKNEEAKEEVLGYLQMDRSEIGKLSSEECGEISYILSSHALYLSLQLNKMQALYNWCVSSINRVISSTLNQYEGSFSQKEIKAIKENVYANALDIKKNKLKINIDSISYVTNHVKNLADILIEQQKTKRRYQ